jgi:hypothetical protein
MRKSRRRGATLPEVLTVSAMLVMLLSGVVTMGVNASTEWSNGSSKLIADNDASLALQALGRDVRDGIRASTDSTGSTLYVVLPYVNGQGDFDRFVDGDTVQYYLSSGNLFRKQGTAGADLLAENVTGLVFSVDGSVVDIQLTSRKQMGTKTGVTTLNTQVMLRNEPPQ